MLFFAFYLSRPRCAAQEYVRTGYVWEQYDALSGEGKRRCVFSGFTLRTLLG